MIKKTKQQYELLNLAGNIEWDLFVTLTFNSKRTMLQASKTLSAFFINVERASFGKQANTMRISRFPVIEHTAEATHFHILMIKPTDKKYAEFKDLLSKKWKRLSGTGWSNLRINGEWYKPIKDTDEDREKVINYTTKFVNTNYETVDFENTTIAI